MNPRTRYKVLPFHPIHIGFDGPEEFALLLLGHWLVVRDEQLGDLRLDQVMQLKPLLFAAGGFVVKKTVRSELSFVAVEYLILIGSLSRGLKVHDQSTWANQIDESPEHRKTVTAEIGFHTDLHSFGFFFRRNWSLTEIHLHKSPCLLPLNLLFTLLEHHGLFRLGKSPVIFKVGFDFLSTTWLTHPAPFTPMLESGMDSFANVECC